jgi:hypothetical protein
MKKYIIRDIIIYNLALTLLFYFIIFLARYYDSFFFSLPFFASILILGLIIFGYRSLFYKKRPLLKITSILTIHMLVYIPIIILSLFGIRNIDNLVPIYSKCLIISDSYYDSTYGGQDIYGDYEVSYEAFDYKFYVPKDTLIKGVKTSDEKGKIFMKNGKYFVKVLYYSDYHDYDIGDIIELGTKDCYSCEIAELMGVDGLLDKKPEISIIKQTIDYFIYILLNGGIYLFVTIITCLICFLIKPSWFPSVSDFSNFLK